MNSLFKLIAPWKMLPPVRLNFASMSTGLSTWRSITDALKPGAYSSTTSKQLSANAFLAASSQRPPRSAYGAYWQNIDIRCFPGGATVGIDRRRDRALDDGMRRRPAVLRVVVAALDVVLIRAEVDGAAVLRAGARCPDTR